MSFSTPPTEIIIINEPEIIAHIPFDYNFNLDYEIVSYISDVIKLDNICPILIYDMDRYMDLSFFNSRPFYQSNFNTFNDFLYNIVTEHGKNMGINEQESHLLFFFSTVKKMFILNIPNSELNILDYYILDWMKINYSVSDMVDFRNIVLQNPDSIIVIQ